MVFRLLRGGLGRFHALFHLSHLAMGATAEAPVAIAVAIPAFLGLALAWPRGEATA
ncbi:hypothetical protein SAMN05444678_11147 [Sphingomonas sp. YR710]|jgi:hypothetical protein|uniref:hypothetical protein n=1 Tax=Sphingomonas sp. YR710 TaxID=1882773 RepID=UPI00088469A5|nr:hypothetical protein [Sphingomonas sp. YR710]SDD27077.1 hypothetical protein SAMN05444678_11147 [Sphingomonas sp. YR710]